ncbi:hypothetical protein GCM10010912_15300 [Paenibacillus albidus]|uniref:Lantibiotic ABC transporter permease n=1 Tax=Paenibacillus albidus TaxID=2041023 RepID=A0A917C453_9BACL|nr:ABC transporter permease [Paenibacillus albidus]GGF71080.1 hypothetical protein GCM10010912_15300 [Paenibacillus albidus]
MKRLMSAEWMKVQRLIILLLIGIDLAVVTVLGINSLDNLASFFPPSWDTLYHHMIEFHALFFYPLYVGIFASLLCRYEHIHGGWKQLLTLPIRRTGIYWSKLGMLMLLMGLTQICFVLTYLLAGLRTGVPGQLDGRALLVGIVGGWLSILPFAALQLWISLRLSSFASSLILSVSMVIPNIVLTGLHATIGAWFPFTAAYYVMFPRGTALSPRLDVLPFILILAVTSLFYIWGGRRFLLIRMGRI